MKWFRGEIGVLCRKIIMELFLILLFVLGYLFIVLEGRLGINKAAFALILHTIVSMQLMNRERIELPEC